MMGLLLAVLGVWGCCDPLALFGYAIPVVADEVAFAFDVVVQPAAGEIFPYYCLRICKTIKAWFDILKAQQDKANYPATA